MVLLRLRVMVALRVVGKRRVFDEHVPSHLLFDSSDDVVKWSAWDRRRRLVRGKYRLAVFNLFVLAGAWLAALFWFGFVVPQLWPLFYASACIVSGSLWLVPAYRGLRARLRTSDGTTF